jgi:hypothetical protein
MRSYRGVWYVDGLLRTVRPDEDESFLRSRQQHGQFQSEMLIPTVHGLVLLVSAIASLWFLVVSWQRREVAPDSLAGFHLTVWIALLGNAAMCANLSGVFDRFQARIEWILPLAVLITLGTSPAPA